MKKTGRALIRLIWLSVGVLSLITGVIGIAVPLLPTVPFLLLAAFAFERGSERAHNWLVTHTKLGPPIEAWQRYGAISKRAKIASLCAMAFLLILSIVLAAPAYAVALQAVILSAVAIFIVTRPLPPD